MSDVLPAARPMKPPMPLWPLTVVQTCDVTPNMRRVTFALENVQGFDHRPGQDLVLMMTGDDGQPGRRHYTVRSIDKAAGRLDIDFLLHGTVGRPSGGRLPPSPATPWRRAARADAP